MQPHSFQPRGGLAPQLEPPPEMGLEALSASTIAHPTRVLEPDPHVAAIAAETLRRHDASRYGLRGEEISPSYATGDRWHSARRVDSYVYDNPPFVHQRPVANPTYLPRQRTTADLARYNRNPDPYSFSYTPSAPITRSEWGCKICSSFCICERSCVYDLLCTCRYASHKKFSPTGG